MLIPPPPKKNYNIILISIDTLRADHLGCYGYQRDTSPNIDAFAKKNILFTNFYTVVPKTGPSMTTFFTGKYMQNHGVVTNPLKRSDEIKMFAELLPPTYKKAAFGANMTLTEESGYSAGFDEYLILPGDQKTLTPKAMKWLSENSKVSNFFLWLDYIDPHGPYKPPKEFHEIFVNDRFYDSTKKVALNYIPQEGLNEHYTLGAVPRYQRLDDIDIVDYFIAQYDAEIRYTDREVGKLIDYLSSENLLKNSIVIITADHGESLGENNYYFEHGMHVSEGSIHIPLIMSHPEIENPLMIDALIQNTDLAPTLLAELGLKFPKPIDGINFSELYRNTKEDFSIRDYIYSCTPLEYDNFYETIRTRPYKLIRMDKKNFSLFNIHNDKRETKDLYGRIDKKQIKENIKLLNKFGKSKIQTASKVKLTKDKLYVLKTLGYTN